MFRLKLGFLFLLTLSVSCVVTTDWDINSSVKKSEGLHLELKLPLDDQKCLSDEQAKNLAYCLNEGDEIKVTKYLKKEVSSPYIFEEIETLFSKAEFFNNGEIITIAGKKDHYHKLLVEIIKPNGVVKLTGGAIDVLFNKKSVSANVFLVPPGDFAKIVKNRSRSEQVSLESYFDENCSSSGSGAVALKNGYIFMSGGHCHQNGEYKNDAMIFEMKNLSSKSVSKLPVPLRDHTVNLIDDGTEKGKVIIAFGETADGNYSKDVYSYDPGKNSYTNIGSGSVPVTMAKAVTIGGEVYITGGCSKTKAETKIYKVSKKGELSEYATLKQGRCNHSIADVSLYDKDGKIKSLRILVLGGSTDDKGENPITGNEGFAEIISGGTSKFIDITDRLGEDNAVFVSRGLVSAASTRFDWDDTENGTEKAVIVAGGYLELHDLINNNKNVFVLSEKNGEEWIYDYSPGWNCSRPSMAEVGSSKNSQFKYFAMNCGAGAVERNNPGKQQVFVYRVRKVYDSANDMDFFTVSINDTLMPYYTDSENGLIIDGPVAVNDLGQVIVMGTQYVYQASSFFSPISGTPPPKPLIKASFNMNVGGPASYRNIRDRVSINLRNTCVSDPAKPLKCLSGWEENYYIQYKWDIVESPTPFQPDSRLKLPDTYGQSGQWLADLNKDNPKRAEFYGLKVTPARTNENNPDFSESKCSECGTEPADDTDEFFINKLSEFLLCRQKYCEKNRSLFYKINVQAETVDKESGLISEMAELTIIPKIIPQSRVVAQLTWDKGYRTKTEASSGIPGTKVDLDLHLIKKVSLEAAERNFTRKQGLMCTYALPPGNIDCFDPYNEKYCRHDDCSFADQGAEKAEIQETIAWNASFYRDNHWGGDSFESPETIGLGSIGVKEARPIIDDEYLVVVNYSFCETSSDDNKNNCCPKGEVDDKGKTCTGEAYEVNARVDIIVDGHDAPRAGDNYPDSTKNFVIKPNEWKVIATIKWDNSLPPPVTNPDYEGSAIVTDVAMLEHEIETDAKSYKTCKFSVAFCELVPIWDKEAYYEFVESPQVEGDSNSPRIGECY